MNGNDKAFAPLVLPEKYTQKQKTHIIGTPIASLFRLKSKNIVCLMHYRYHGYLLDDHERYYLLLSIQRATRTKKDRILFISI